jgi:hypothetical protein
LFGLGFMTRALVVQRDIRLQTKVIRCLIISGSGFDRRPPVLLEHQESSLEETGMRIGLEHDPESVLFYACFLAKPW